LLAKTNTLANVEVGPALADQVQYGHFRSGEAGLHVSVPDFFEAHVFHPFEQGFQCRFLALYRSLFQFQKIYYWATSILAHRLLLQLCDFNRLPTKDHVQLSTQSHHNIAKMCRRANR
jgi:hypothetical protein